MTRGLYTQMGAYSGLRKGSFSGPKSPKTDQVTTKLLVAASDKLWQYVLQGSTPRVIAHPVEFEEAGGRPHTLDHFDYDKFAKCLWEIKDEGDESPQRAPRDLRGQHVPLPPPALKEPELPQWQV